MKSIDLLNFWVNLLIWKYDWICNLTCEWKIFENDLINPHKIHYKTEMNRSNEQQNHNTKIVNEVHPFKAMSPSPLQRKSVFIKNNEKT